MTPTTRAPAKLGAIIAERLTTYHRRLVQDIGRLAKRQGAAVYAVGGCVRDWLLRRPVEEVDVTVEGDSVALAKRFAAEHDGAVPVPPQFRTAAVVYRAGTTPRRVAFAACRKERYKQPAAYPTVSPGSLQDDLFRRDFTVNAMAMHVTPARFGRLVDVFRGADDVEARLIRVLHARSFHDDPSRILRAIRFAERLRFTIEPQTAAWMRTELQDNGLARLNRGRLRKELLAMLEEPDPLAMLRAMGQWLLGARVR